MAPYSLSMRPKTRIAALYGACLAHFGCPGNLAGSGALGSRTTPIKYQSSADKDCCPHYQLQLKHGLALHATRRDCGQCHRKRGNKKSKQAGNPNAGLTAWN